MDENSKSGFLEIGDGVVIEGNITLPETVFVNGTVTGDLRAGKVLVGPAGVIRGKVYANTADIQGSIKEFINVADHLVLRSSARLEGHVEYQTIEIEDGAQIDAILKHIGAQDSLRQVSAIKPTESEQPMEMTA